MKTIKILRAISLIVLTYQFYMYSTYKAGIETWHIFTGVLGFNALLYIIEIFRKEK